MRDVVTAPEGEQSVDVMPYVMALKRRWWLIALPIVLITPIAAAIAYVLPPTYSATARILVESQQIPSDLAQSTVRVSVEERIALIEQRLMTRENLLDVASRLNVTDGLGPMSPTDIVRMMRRSTRINGLRLAGGRGPVTGVNVSFTANRASLTAQVANEFVTLLLEQNVQQRTDRAFETSAYFRDEVERLSNELAQIERRITNFKLDNDDALPDSLAFRREELASLEQRVFEREVSQLELTEQRQRLEEALRSGEFGDIERNETPEERELRRLRQQLVERRSVYSDAHPIVRSLSSRIEVLEARVVDANAAFSPDEELLTPREQVERAIMAITEQIERIEQRRVNEIRRIAALEESIARTPSVELELNALVREMGAIQTQYREAVLKRARAETGERLEVNQQAERFELIERAEVPARPSSPNRPMIIAAGFVGSAGLGVGLVLLLQLLNSAVTMPGDLERRLNITPIVSVPLIRTASERRRRLLLTVVSILTVLFGVSAGLYMIDTYYLPLSLLFERLGSMLGLDRLMTMINARIGG